MRKPLIKNESALRGKHPCSRPSNLEEDAELRNERKARSRVKRDPLPMKMRALPQSFWQEPNASGTFLFTDYSVPWEEDRDSHFPNRVVGKANTDLLFSLFQCVRRQGDKPERTRVPRRGRPRKEKKELRGMKTGKDDDPYVASAVFCDVQHQENGKMARQQQVLTLLPVTTNDNCSRLASYSDELSNLVVNL